jgi:hypothetical protein
MSGWRRWSQAVSWPTGRACGRNGPGINAASEALVAKAAAGKALRKKALPKSALRKKAHHMNALGMNAFANRTAAVKTVYSTVKPSWVISTVSMAIAVLSAVKLGPVHFTA